jgi:LysM repeat protein
VPQWWGARTDRNAGVAFKLAVLSRYLTHAVILVIVLTVSGYASIGHPLPSQLGLHTDANALMMNQGGDVSDFYLGRQSTIVKPLSIPSSVPMAHTPTTYTVADGEDLPKIATKFNVTVEEIRWSNPILKETDRVTAGVKLSIPPTHGIVVSVHAGDTADSLAGIYHVTSTTILDFNRLRIDPNALPVGMELVLPGAQGPALTIKTEPWPSVVRFSSGYKVTLGAPIGPYVNSKFPWGWCTWYVSTRRNVTWAGDAYQWFANAQAQGYPVGSSPQAGSIMVTWESGLGHVAYVESVDPDGSWLVSEANFRGFGVTSQRVLKPGQVPLIGFIYNK